MRLRRWGGRVRLFVDAADNDPVNLLANATKNSAVGRKEETSAANEAPMSMHL
jgi:hypothetical protein